jgi:hypothetical protein
LSHSDIVDVLCQDKRLRLFSCQVVSDLLGSIIYKVFQVKKIHKRTRGRGYPLMLICDETRMEIDESDAVRDNMVAIEERFSQRDETNDQNLEAGIKLFVQNNLVLSNDSVMKMPEIIDCLIETYPSYSQLKGNTCLGRFLGLHMSSHLGIVRLTTQESAIISNEWGVQFVPTSGIESG